MADELKPCPFHVQVRWGEPPEFDQYAPELKYQPVGDWWFVTCNYCEAYGPSKHTEEQAITAWNNRRKDD